MGPYLKLRVVIHLKNYHTGIAIELAGKSKELLWCNVGPACLMERLCTMDDHFPR